MKNLARGPAERLRRDPRNLFYLISAAGILLYFLLSLPYGGRLYAWMVQENAPEIRFIDYFSHLESVENPGRLYLQIAQDADGSYAAVFPPLAYALYYLLCRLTAVAGGRPAGMKIEAVPGALSVFTLYLIFNAVIFLAAIEITGKRDRKKDLLLFTLLMLSAVFAGSGYMLGNSAVLVAGLLLLALSLKDSPRAPRRELGLLTLAVCVAMKLYPAVFGLVFLKEKRYKDLLRLILYSLVLTFAPFCFFGGIEGLQAWIGNLTGPLESAGLYGRPQFLKGAFYTVIRMLTGREEAALSTALTVAVCLAWIWLAWRSSSAWRTQFFLICVMVFFPSGAYRYTLAYFSIPLAFLLKSEPEEKPGAWPVGTVSALYGLLYTIPVWWLPVCPIGRAFSVRTLTGVEIYLYLIAYLLVIAVTAAELTARKKAYGRLFFPCLKLYRDKEKKV